MLDQFVLIQTTHTPQLIENPANAGEAGLVGFPALHQQHSGTGVAREQLHNSCAQPGGLEGKLSFLDLTTRRSGDLLLSPGRRPLIQLALTPDRQAIVATAHQFDFETRKQTPCFFQVWSYPVLCRASGLEH